MNVTTPLVEAAQSLALHGFRVHPAVAKRPVLTGWEALATTDPSRVVSLFSDERTRQIGIATGGGLFIFDLDLYKTDGADTARKLEEQHGPLPRTVTAVTGNGGRQYYFRAPEGVQIITKRGILPGADVRGEGGNAIAPPSVHHESGKPYGWLPGCSPDEVSVAMAPAWLVELVRKKKAPAPKPRPMPAARDLNVSRRASQYLARIPGAVSGQGGHDQTLVTAIHMVRGFGLSEDEAFALLWNEYNPRCEPPWSEKELWHKIRDAAEKSTAEWGFHKAQEWQPPSTRTEMPSARAEARAAAEGVPPPPPETPAQGTPPAPPSGAIPITKSYASLCQILRTPDMRREVLGDGALEFNMQTLEPMIARRPIVDTDLSRIRELAERAFTADPSKPGKGIQFAANDVQAAVLQVAHEREFHPVAEYLRGLTWDGTPRIDSLALRVLGIPAEETLSHKLIRKWLIATVARALRPGCKVDIVLILIGKQGALKSSFFQALASTRWFSDKSINLHDKDSQLLLRRVWVLEWAELDSMQRARNADAVKAFITSQVDHVRPPYARGIGEFPRTCVIVGTTNNKEFLVDETGNRRFWPVEVPGDIDIPTVEAERDQIWAEAVRAFDEGERWWLEKEDEESLARTQREFSRADAWEEKVIAFATRNAWSTAADILVQALDKPIGQITRTDEMRVSAILRAAQFQHKRKVVDGVQAWRWIAPLEPVT